MKTLTKNQQQKNQRLKSKQDQVAFSTNTRIATDTQPEQELETLSAYDSYYKQLAEEVESVERHVRELRQTPGLEDLTEDEAQEQIDFMLRYSVWVFNQHQQEPQIAMIADEDEIEAIPAEVFKVQNPKGKVTKKVTEFLSH